MPVPRLRPALKLLELMAGVVKSYPLRPFCLCLAGKKRVLLGGGGEKLEVTCFSCRENGLSFLGEVLF